MYKNYISINKLKNNLGSAIKYIDDKSKICFKKNIRYL